MTRTELGDGPLKRGDMGTSQKSGSVWTFFTAPGSATSPPILPSARLLLVELRTITTWLVLTCSNCGISNIYTRACGRPFEPEQWNQVRAFQSVIPVGEKRSLNPISKRHLRTDDSHTGPPTSGSGLQVSRHTLGLKIRPARQSYGNGWHRCHKNGSKNVPLNFKVGAPGCQPPHHLISRTEEWARSV